MPTIKSLEDQGRALVLKQKDVYDDDRDWSEKAGEFGKIDADIKSVFAQRQALLDVEDNGRKFDGAGTAPAQKTATSLGGQFVESTAFKGLPTGGSKGRFSTGGVELKATYTEAAGAAGQIVPTYLPNVTQVLFRRLQVADLFPGGSISGNTLIYPKESTVTNAAAAVAEGSPKPGSDLNVVQVTEHLTKIATTLKVSDETLEDVPATMSYIDGRLTLFVQLTEEDQVLNGSGTAPNMTGLLNRSGLTTAAAVPGTPTSTDRADTIFKQIIAIQATAFIDVDGIVINPLDWETLRLSKDANNQYFGGGPFTGAYGNGGISADSLWGKRVVVTPAIAAGTALVGGFQMSAQLFRKGGITVDMTNSNEDDFKNNLVAVRAEERLLLAVYRPAGFGKVTGL